MTSTEKKKRLLASIGILSGIFICALDWSIVSTALPVIQNKLNTSIVELQWIMNIFGVCISSLLVTMGRISDLYGRRRIFLIGITIFGISSVLGGMAPNATWLLICRGFQGISASILFPGSQSLMIHAYPDEQKGRALGIWSAVTGIALSLGPVLGGIIVSFLSWRWIFYINFPIAVFSFIFVRLSVLESKDTEGNMKIDWWGVTFLTLTIATLVISIIQAPIWGWNSPVFIILFVIGCLLLIIFLLIEKKVEYPIIKIELFLKPAFIRSSITNFSLVFYVWSIFFLMPLYLHNVLNFEPYLVGFVMLAITLPLAAVSFTAGHIYDRKGIKFLLIPSYIFLIVSIFLQTFLSSSFQPGILIAALLIMGIGWGFIWSPSTTAGISTLPKNVSNLAAGALATMQEIGGAVGLAIAGSLFRYYDQLALDRSLKEEGIVLSDSKLQMLRSLMDDPEAFKKHFQSFGSQTTKIPELVKSSFMSGFTTTMWLLFVLLVVALVLCLFLLPKKETN